MNSIVDEHCVLSAVVRDIPPAAHRNYKLWQVVLVYNEYKKEWLGPFIVVDITGRMITLYNPETKLLRNFNTLQNKPYERYINERYSHCFPKATNLLGDKMCM